MLTLGQRNTVIKSMISLINAEKIFIHSVSTKGDEAHYITVLVSNFTIIPMHQMLIKKYLPLDDHEGFYYVIHRNDQLLTEISNGNLYLLWVCTPTNLIYSQQKTTLLLPLPDLRADLLSTAIVHLNAGLKKVYSFIRGALFYHQRGESGLTTFMLHQAAEITYRTIGQSILGKEVRSHKLHIQQIWLCSSIPHLPVIFEALSPKETELLALLNLSYAAARYETSFSIQESQIRDLFDCINTLVTSSITLADELIGLSNTDTDLQVPVIPMLSNENRYLRMRTAYFVRMNRAHALLKAGESLLKEEHHETNAALFSQSITQVCLAIIGLYANGYQPGHILLIDLLDLCHTYWPNHKLQQQRKDPKYNRIYGLLYKSENAHKYDYNWSVQKQDLPEMHQLCENFLHEAGLTGLKKLHDIEQSTHE